MLESKNLLIDHVKKSVKVIRNNTSEIGKETNSKTTFSLIQRDSADNNGSMTSPLKKDSL
jgi:hypothetical protein